MTRKQAWILFIPIGLLIVMIGVDLLGAGLALTPMSRQFSVPMSDLQWFMAAFAIGNSAFLVTVGKLVDRYGQRIILLIGVVVFVLSSAVIAGSPNYWLSVAMRFTQGMSGAMMATTGVAIVASAHSPEERHSWIGAMIGAGGFGMAIGPLLGGYLIGEFGWRSLFLVNVPIGIVAFILAFTSVKSSAVEHKKEPLDLLGMLFFIGAIVSLTMVLNNGQVWGWASHLTLMMTGVFVVLMIVFLLIEQRAPMPLLKLSLFKVKNFLPANLLALSLYFGLIAWVICFSIYYQHVLLYSALQTGIRFFPLAIMMLVGAVLMSKIVARFSSKKSLLIFACCLNLVGYAALALVPLSNFVFVSMAFFILGLGFVVMNANTISVAIEFLPMPMMGIGSGTALMIRWLGGALGAAIAGSLLTSLVHQRLWHSLPQWSLMQKQHLMHFLHSNAPLSADSFHDMALRSFFVQQMTFAVHVVMGVTAALFLFNLLFSAVAIRKKTPDQA